MPDMDARKTLGVQSSLALSVEGKSVNAHLSAKSSLWPSEGCVLVGNKDLVHLISQ